MVFALECGPSSLIYANGVRTIVARLNGALAPATTWVVSSGGGTLTAMTGSSTTLIPPNFAPSPFVAATSVVTATLGTQTATCTYDLVEFFITGPVVLFFGDSAAPVSVTRNGFGSAIAWKTPDAGTLTPTSGLTTSYLPPAAGSSTIETLEARAGSNPTLSGLIRQNDVMLAQRPTRGATLFAYGLVPIRTSPVTRSLVAGTYQANGASTYVTRGSAAGEYTVEIEGGTLTTPTVIEVAGYVLSARCTLTTVQSPSFSLRCTDRLGVAMDTPFVFRVTQTGRLGNAGVVAFAAAGSTASFSGTQVLSPASSYSVIGSIDVTNLAVGSYRVTFPSVTTLTPGQVHVTASTTGSVLPFRCSLALVMGNQVSVLCADLTGAAVNGTFTVSVASPLAATQGAVSSFTTLEVAPSQLSGASLAPTRTFFGGGTIASFTQLQRQGPGTYRLLFAPTARPGTAVATHIAPVDDTTGSCFVTSRSEPIVDVQCSNTLGMAADLRFSISFLSASRPSLATISGYGLVNGLSTSGSPQTVTSSFNQAQGSVTSVRSAAGSYRVTFQNVTLTNSLALATAYGPNGRCTVLTTGADFVDVRCFDASSNPADTLFYLATMTYPLGAPGPGSTARVLAQARVEGLSQLQPTATLDAERSVTAGSSIAAARTGAGTYTVTFAGLPQPVNVQVSAQYSSRFCGVSAIAGSVVTVLCNDGLGAADSDFAISVYGDLPDAPGVNTLLSASEVMGFAIADNPTAASYAPGFIKAYNPTALPIAATRSATGMYSLWFTGQSLRGGIAHVFASGSTARCNTWSIVDDRIDVRCFDVAGLPTDSQYVIVLER